MTGMRTTKHYRNVVERSNMINNDEVAIYTDHPLEFDSNTPDKLVFSRPVYQEEIDDGLKLLLSPISCFDEEIHESTRLMDSFFRLKIRLAGFKEAFQQSWTKAIAHYIAFNYYDCMSGGMSRFDIVILKYALSVLPDIDLSEEVYPGKKDGLNSWYTLADFLDDVKEVPSLDEFLKHNQKLLPILKDSKNELFFSV